MQIPRRLTHKSPFDPLNSMSKRLFSLGRFSSHSGLFLLGFSWFLTINQLTKTPPVWAQSSPETLISVTPTTTPPVIHQYTGVEPTQPKTQNDPLNSPHPIPWEWILRSQAEVNYTNRSGIRYYWTPPLTSPDRHYAVYSRIILRAEPRLHRSQVDSVMFIKNLQTGELKTITPLSNFSQNSPPSQPGKIMVLIPVSWNEKGNLLLAREFEAIFSSSDMTDYGMIWDRETNRTITLRPTLSPNSHSVLLGWSQRYPNQVLFRAGEIGESDWKVWSVNLDGQTKIAQEDHPVIFGHPQKYIGDKP